MKMIRIRSTGYYRALPLHRAVLEHSSMYIVVIGNFQILFFPSFSTLYQSACSPFMCSLVISYSLAFKDTFPCLLKSASMAYSLLSCHSVTRYEFSRLAVEEREYC